MKNEQFEQIITRNRFRKILAYLLLYTLLVIEPVTTMHKKFRDLRHSIEQHSSRDDNNLLVIVVEVLCTYLCSYTCPQYEAKQARRNG